MRTQPNVCVTVCEEKRSTERVEEWRRGGEGGGGGNRGRIEISACLGPCWLSYRQITGSSCQLCLWKSSLIKWQICYTFTFIRSEKRGRGDERGKGCVCVCACVRVGGPVYVCARKCLFLSLLPSRGQLPAPPRATLPSQAFHSAACFSSSSPSSSETSVSEYAMSVSKRIHPRSAQS